MARSNASFDVLMVTDCRFPGGNSSSVVEEIQAQHRAGYRTGILHLPSTVLKHPRAFNPKIRKVLDRGLAELVVGADVVETRLLLARHPTVFTDIPVGTPEVRTERVLLAVNQVPVDERGEQPYYDVLEVERNLERLGGRPATWAPIGPRVRETMVGLGELVDLSPSDWENVIDVDSWMIRREGFVGDRPVLGRASRGHWTKWPDNRGDLLAAYPDDPRYVVSILGGADTPRKLLGGRLPPNWIDHPFNSVPAQEYLAGIDFLVYFHHPGLIEAFGRVVLEAMSTGAVCIVPPYLERLFGDVCLYGRPQDVRTHVDELYGDWPAFKERSDRGVDLALERFSYRTHLRRIEELIGRPSGPGAQPAVGPAAAAPSPPPRRLLVVDLVAADAPARAAIDRLVGDLTVDHQVVLAVAAERLDVPVPEGAVVETFARARRLLAPAERRRYVEARLARLLDDHAPAELIVVSDDLAAIDLADVPGLLVTPSDAGLPAAPSVLTARLLAAAPTGWSVRILASADPAGVTSADGDAQTSTPDDSRRTADLRRSVPLPIRQAKWRAGLIARRGRRWVSQRLRRARGRLRPAVAWIRIRRARTLATVAQRSGLVVLDAEQPGPGLPTRGVETHPDPDRLPNTMVVITSGADPETTIRRFAERQQETSAFRLCFLVPASWEPSASRFGYATETVVTEPLWTGRLHRDDWPAYLGHRIAQARAVLSPTTTLLAGDLRDPADLSPLLETLEATGAKLDRR